MPSQVIGRVQPVNQGNYDATRAYVVLDRVKYQGAWYECQADAAAGTAPEAGGNAWWLEIGGRGADGLTPTPVWNGSELHFAYSDGTTTSAVDLQGPQGVQGEQGVPGQTPPLTSGLTSTAPDVALSALGGKTLKDLVDAAQGTADGKANADLDDVTAAGKAVMAHAAMPSSQSISLSVPASGGTIVAPADGWVEFKFAKASGASYGSAVLSGAVYSSLEVTTGNYNYITLPVRSGINVQISYQNTQLMSLRFLYANGSAPTN